MSFASASYAGFIDVEDALAYLTTGEQNHLFASFPFIPPETHGVPEAGSGFIDSVLEVNAELLKKKQEIDRLTLEREEIRAVKPSTKASKKVSSILKKTIDAANIEYTPLVKREAAILYWRALYDPNFVYRYITPTFSTGYKQLPGQLLAGTQHGPSPAPVMVIGKSPSYQEISSGTVFNSESGRLFLQMLGSLGLDYEKWYATYLVKIINPNKSGSAFPAGVVKDYAPILANEIRLVKPKYILCLGSEAVKAVLGRDKNVSNTAGMVYSTEYELNDGTKHEVKVVSCISPSSIIFDPASGDELRLGLERFVDVLNGKKVTAGGDRDYRVIRTDDELTSLVDELLATDRREFSIDLEWDGNFPLDVGAYVRTLQFSWGVGTAAAVVLHLPGGARGPLSQEVFLTQMLRLFDRPNLRIIGHYFSADAVWLEHLGLKAVVDHFCEDLRDDLDNDVFGWALTTTRGGFDTILAAHAVNETGPLGLKELTLRHTNLGPYSHALDEWKQNHSALVERGFGNIPEDILLPYAMTDVDATFRLYHVFNGETPGNGYLDKDRFGNCCREPFWRAMRAWKSFYDMHKTGLVLDLDKYTTFRKAFEARRDQAVETIRRLARWPTFNPSSSPQRVELLFGEEYTGNVDAEGNPEPLRPPGAVSLKLVPYKTTGQKEARLWDTLDESEVKNYRPATDKETLTYLTSSDPIVKELQACTKLWYICNTLLVAPDEVNGIEVYKGGPRSFLSGDGRVHSFFSQTKETGRASSSRPPMQNWSKRFEKLYKTLLGEAYPGPIRSMIKARPGWVLIEADLTAAEVAAAAWMSNDANLINHAYRSTLPEDHPDHYDIHSNTAVKSFKLQVKPTKTALEEAGLIHLRTAAKTRFFGWFYGQGDLAAWRKIKEDGAEVSLQEVKALSSQLAVIYPDLVSFLRRTGDRVETHGWLCNAGGRFRRFHTTENDGVLAKQKREAGNFYIQGLVAEAMNEALYNFSRWKSDHPDERFELVLQVHDAVVLEVPLEDAARVKNEVIPYCMVEKVPIVPCDLDGTPRRVAPYRFGIDTEVYSAWGIKLDKAVAAEYGLST